MPVTPAVATDWLVVMKAAGPYGVIAGLLFLLYKLVGFVREKLKEKDALAAKHVEEIRKINQEHAKQIGEISQERVSDLQEILKASGEKQDKLTEALAKLTTLLQNAKASRRRDTSNGS